ncbi:MAG: succinate--CoA ligase subunit beta, partial [Verrucomicrobia bacterium]|nr:succinate--CoA ligase subunit beta [Verrucomicrobiota bacterium]
MNIHEYQAKTLFEKFGVAVPKGAAVQTAKEFEGALAQLDGTNGYMVKSQIHAGGRGKGTFTNGFKGGVKFSATKEKALENAQAMLGNTLVTAQTGAEGRKVQTIYFTEAANLGKRADGRDDEYYLAILLDRATSCPVIVASTEGGMEIEHVAHHTPEKIFKVQVDPAVGLQAFQARQIAFSLGFSGEIFKQCVTLVTKLYQFYWDKD